jgi:hypothetical protein
MDQICLALPILEGKTQAARDLMRELEERKEDYARSEERIGITMEVWFLAKSPSGDQLVAYIESPNFAATAKLFIESQDEFDLWFKKGLAEVTGVDMNNPPENPQFPELLSSYKASEDRGFVAEEAAPSVRLST